MSTSRRESLLTRGELQELICMKKVTVDMSAKRTIENGEVNIEAPCICTPEQQIRRDNSIFCRHCKRPIAQSDTRVVEECDLMPQTFVSISVEPHDTHSIITSRTIVSDSERIYEVSGDHDAEKLSLEVWITNLESRIFSGVFMTNNNTESSGVVDCRSFQYSPGKYLEICPGSGEVRCVLKKPCPGARWSKDFMHDNNTLLTLRFRAPHLMKVAFCMLLHKRLGKASTWSCFNKDQVQMICTLF